ncbi:hypothetical protein ABZ756_13950 [Mammaliicoccus sciuri]|uniref:Uncharacterized protein n=1 Tax=Sporosarcina newyorkensis 2681 TaxID=1027292 RepID=F9DT75_9BACL|nr:hypothetical protein [Sporosarcina newyorkensis]EGQ25991.1 hypothetical protein HMPREF9372_2006 [Sporosarcina newyorkensis 2681]
MTSAKQLVRHIVVQRQGLRELEEKLYKLQAECIHEYIETSTHRECEKCQKVESIHY